MAVYISFTLSASSVKTDLKKMYLQKLHRKEAFFACISIFETCSFRFGTSLCPESVQFHVKVETFSDLNWIGRLVLDELSFNWQEKALMKQLGPKLYTSKKNRLENTWKYIFNNFNMRSFKETSLISGLHWQQDSF